MSRDLLSDWDHTFFEAIKVLSDAYVSLHKPRVAEGPKLVDEDELENHFWGLQRSSTVIDSIVGSACVILMRWMDQTKRIAIANFILLETKFPFETEQKSDKEKQKSDQKKWNHYNQLVMKDFGTRVPGKEGCGAQAIWQIGNVFKHGAGDGLHKETKRVAVELGFSSQILEIPEHEGEEDLRQMAFREVAYTLDADSIERMALQLGCGPVPGLMPLYNHVESWQKAIEKKLHDEEKTLRGLL